MKRALTIGVVLGCAALAASAGLWNSAYYAGWMQSYLPAAQVDFAAMTHVIHFAVVPNANGSLDSNVNVVTVANSTSVITNAHAAGVKVLISFGGAGSADGFRGATSQANLAKFITNIVNLVTARGYDGVDLDWEPLEASDAGQYTNLVYQLRAALNGINPRPLLSAAVATQPALFATLQGQFDQINLMTYDLSGPWPGWITWFNSPVVDGGTRFVSTGGLVPSCDGMVSNFVASGVAPGKLGVGIDFYGYVWSGGAGTSTGGASLPRQTWTTAPTVSSAAYYTIMSTYYQPQLYFWDTNGQAAYLSINQTGSSNDKFISYDDETTCRVKVEYAMRKGLGGVMIWELGGGYRSTQPAGQRDPLLQALKQALADQFFITAISPGGDDVHLTISTVAGMDYRVEWAVAPGASSWNLVTNVTATGPSTQVVDLGAATQPERFYRVH